MQEWNPQDLDEDWKITKARQFEALRVRWLLQQLGQLNWLERIRREDEAGEQRVTFRAFDNLFPNFPMYFGAQWRHRLEGDTACRTSALFREFERSPVFTSYVEFMVELKDEEKQDSRQILRGRPAGLVLPWRNMQQGLLVHNNLRLDTEGLKWSVQLRKKHGRARLVVEPFARAIKAILASDWTKTNNGATHD